MPGIGKKTAERLLLELKDKIGSTDGDDLDFVDSTGTLTGTVVDDAMAALVTLGYTNSEIIPVIKQIQNRDTMKSEEIIRQALKLMARR